MVTSLITDLHVEDIKKTPGDTADTGEQRQHRGGGGTQPRRD